MKHPRLRFPCRDVINIIIRLLGNESLYEYERPRGDVAASHYGGRQCRHRQVIRQVSAEYGLTADKGYTVADPNLDELYELYSQPGSAYWVVEQEGKWLAAAASRRSPAASRISASCRKCIL